MIAKHPGQCVPHEYQDQTYGEGYRVMNDCKVDQHTIGYRCTVCAPRKENGKRRAGIYLRHELIIKRG